MISALLLACLAAVATAQQPDFVQSPPAANFNPNYWTPARMAAAKEFVPSFSASGPASFTPSASSTPSYAAGQPPTQFTLGGNVSLHGALVSPNSDVVPSGAGTSGLYYTSSRLVPLTADLAYPHTTIGKVFFVVPPGTGEPTGNYVCSASVIRKRVVLTAGHCVHSGKNGNSGWYTNFVFVPAFRDGAAPFGSWSHQFFITSSAWFTGLGSVPNARDYAVVVMRDLGGVKLGNRVGTLGWATSSLSPNHVSLFGYPCNIDACQKMHRVDSGAYRARAPNCVEYGSDMRGGSSGGPWIQNFGAAGVGQPAANSRPGFNQVVGVTSYGPVDTNPKYQGSSILDATFTSMVNQACAANAGNCV